RGGRLGIGRKLRRHHGRRPLPAGTRARSGAAGTGHCASHRRAARLLPRRRCQRGLPARVPGPVRADGRRLRPARGRPVEPGGWRGGWAVLRRGGGGGRGTGLGGEAAGGRRGTSLNFIGNVEPKDVLAGRADVVVADGFVGNVAIKMAEATADLVFRTMREEI